MIGIAGAIVSWLAGGAWKWALPLVALATVAAWGAYERSGWNACEAAAKAFADEADRKAAAFKAADAANGQKIADAYAAGVEYLKGPYNAAISELGAAKTTVVPACNSTPSARAFDNGMRPAPGAGTGH